MAGGEIHSIETADEANFHRDLFHLSQLRLYGLYLPDWLEWLNLSSYEPYRPKGVDSTELEWASITRGARMTGLTGAPFYHSFFILERLDPFTSRGFLQCTTASGSRSSYGVYLWTLTWEVSLFTLRWDPEIVDWSGMTCLVVLRIKNLSSGLVRYGIVVGIMVPPLTTRLPLRTSSMPLDAEDSRLG